MFRIITLLIVGCFIAVPTSFADEVKTRSMQLNKTRMVKRSPALSQKKLSSKEQSTLLRREMQKLGFRVRSIQPKSDGSWDIQVNGFDPGRAAGAYRGAIGLPGNAMNDGEDAPTGNPEGPDSGGGDGGGEDAPTGNPEDPDGGDGGGEDAPGGPPDTTRWNMNDRRAATSFVAKNATLNADISEEGLIVLNQESFGQAGFNVSVGGGLCDMFSCMDPALGSRSLPATNTAVSH